MPPTRIRPSIQFVREQRLDAARNQLYKRAIWIAIVGNGLLALAKGLAAWISGSSAVLATAVDSFTDLIYTLFMAWGLWRSQQPADESHPQGHTRIEPIVSAVIALMMGLAGWEVAKQAFGRLLGDATGHIWDGTIGILLVSGLVKIVMFLLVRRLGEQAHSPAIAASAKDNLADVYSSVAALLGVLSANWLHPMADPLAGLLIALWIFRNAFGILLENVGFLTGKTADPLLLETICQTVDAIEGVLGVHQVIADYVGPQVRVELHVDVNGDIPLHAAHALSDQIQSAVEGLEQVDLAFVHVEPAQPEMSGKDTRAQD